MVIETTTESIAHIVQLAVTPAFLMTGIGATLGVMTTRLGRVIDRARTIDELEHADPEVQTRMSNEIATLRRRARVIGLSIGLCTLSALLIATVIAILFLGAFVELNTSMTVAMLFIAAMLFLITALLLFLHEVLLASARLRIGT